MRTRRTLYAVPLFCTALICAAVPGSRPADATPGAQTGSTVSGEVVDAGTGKAVAGASVHAAGTRIFTRTDDTGGFTLRDVPRDSVRVVGAKEGYAFTSEPIGSEEIRLELERAKPGTTPRRSYPRPDMDRRPFTNGAWQSLNGTWSFDFDPDGVGEQQGWFEPSHEFTKSIRVPFPYQSLAAWGEGARASDHLWASAFSEYRGAVWYKRSFTVPESFDGHATRLRIGAADWGATVWLDGREVTDGQRGTGFGEIRVDLGALEPGSSHELVIEVVAPPTGNTSPYPMGKQMGWFTDIGGIWQSVWIEPVDTARITQVHATPHVEFKGDARRPTSASVAVDVEADGAKNGTARVELVGPDDKTVDTVHVRLEGGAGTTEIPVRDPTLWEPESPSLYRVRVSVDGGSAGDDGIVTRTGLRQIRRDWAPGHSPAETDDPKDQYQYVYLNNRPIFVRGVLDQAYNPWGIYTYTGVTQGPDFVTGDVKNPQPGSMLYDLRTAKRQGFNMVRTHIKINEPAYYYWADKLGLLVFQDMPNTPYNAFSDKAHKRWEKVMRQAIARDYNHPSIVTWVLFNEGWGIGGGAEDVREEDRPWVADMTNLAQDLDPTRLVVDNSPTLHNRHQVTDLNDFHWYSGSWKAWKQRLDDQAAAVYPGSQWNFYEPYKQGGQPWMNAEFGSGPDKFRMHTGLFRSYDKMAGYVYTEVVDQEHEFTTAYSYTRQPKEVGYIDHTGTRRGLEMFNGPDTVSIMSKPNRRVEPGTTLSLPVRFSHWSDLDLDGARLHWKVAGTDALGNWVDPDVEGSRSIQPARYSVTHLGDTEVTLPRQLRTAYVWVWVESGNETVAESYISVDLSLGSDAADLGAPGATTFDLADPLDKSTQWTGGTTDIVHTKNGARSITGVGRGDFRYHVKVPDAVRTGESHHATLVLEAASYSRMPGLLEGATGDPMKHPDLATYTSESKEFPTRLTVSVDYHDGKTVTLPDDPYDARAVAGAATHPGQLRYGGRIAVPLDVDRLRGHDLVTLGLAVDGGGLALFGPGTGRYGIAPQVVPTKVAASTKPMGTAKQDEPGRDKLPDFAARPTVYLAQPDGNGQGPGTAIVTVVNDTQRTMYNVRQRLALQDGVSAEPLDDTSVDRLDPGEVRHIGWRITASGIGLGQAAPTAAMATAKLGKGATARQVLGRVDVGLTVQGEFNPADYPVVGIADGFDTDTSADYDLQLPHPNAEPMPKRLRFGNGELAATDNGAYYVTVASKLSPTSPDSAVIVDPARFIRPRVKQDTFFFGLAKDANNYVMPWYASLSKGNGIMGIDVVVDGEVTTFRAPGHYAVERGDRLAAAYDGTDVSLWLNHGDGWDVIYGADVGEHIDLSDPSVLSEYTYAAGLRGNHGTLGLDRLVGRSKE